MHKLDKEYCFDYYFIDSNCNWCYNKKVKSKSNRKPFYSYTHYTFSCQSNNIFYWKHDHLNKVEMFWKHNPIASIWTVVNWNLEIDYSQISAPADWFLVCMMPTSHVTRAATLRTNALSPKNENFWKFKCVERGLKPLSWCMASRNNERFPHLDVVKQV